MSNDNSEKLPTDINDRLCAMAVFKRTAFPQLKLYDTNTHVPIKKPKWRKFSEELPDKFKPIVVWNAGMPINALHLSDGVINCAIPINESHKFRAPSFWYWTYANELDLSALLP